jgi:Na+/proline symporter
VLWWIILCGAVITTGYTFFFGFESFAMHLAMTATVAVSLALVIVLIIAIDWPFRGEVSISPAPFIATQRSWSAMPVNDSGAVDLGGMKSRRN